MRAEDEREFDYNEKSEKGPQHWGDLKKEWEACKNGRMQSPIDLGSKRVRVNPKLGHINNTYIPQNATLTNRGHDIQVPTNMPLFSSLSLQLQHKLCILMFIHLFSYSVN